jgi:predicted nucleotidyltransferase
MAQSIPTQVSSTIHALEPAAEITLFGSRSRGDAGPESDWDFLILLEGPVPDDRKDSLRHALYEIELESGELISSIIVSRDHWEDPRFQEAPFYRNVEREGLRV